MSSVQKWKDVLGRETVKNIHTNGVFAEDSRQIRAAISELRRDGIIFIPTDTHYYTKLNPKDVDDRKIIEQFVRTQVAHLATQYFNTVRPLKNYIADAKLIEMIGQLSFMDDLERN